MARKRLSLSDQVRKAMDASGISRYRIAKETGISQATLSRFMSGDAGISLEYLDRLAEFLVLDIARGDSTRKGR